MLPNGFPWLTELYTSTGSVPDQGVLQRANYVVKV